MRYEPDEVVFDAACHDQQACLTLNILVDGLVRFAPVGTPDDAFSAIYWERLHSGAMFSFLACNLFGIFLGVEPLTRPLVIVDCLAVEPLPLLSGDYRLPWC